MANLEDESALETVNAIRLQTYSANVKRHRTGAMVAPRRWALVSSRARLFDQTAYPHSSLLRLFLSVRCSDFPWCSSVIALLTSLSLLLLLCHFTTSCAALLGVVAAIPSMPKLYMPLYACLFIVFWLVCNLSCILHFILSR